jgi:hypothetical protein
MKSKVFTQKMKRDIEHLRAITEVEFYGGGDEDRNFCATIFNSVAERYQMLSNIMVDTSNNCCNSAFLNKFL